MPFAAGGLVEDPATGAAAAAFAGYLRDLGWPHGGAIDIVQGEDMGFKSLIHAEIGEHRRQLDPRLRDGTFHGRSVTSLGRLARTL